MRAYKVFYAVFIASILFDLSTTVLCFQMSGIVETNLVYQMVGMWAFPIVLLIDATLFIVVEWLRKYQRWTLFILLIPILANIKATVINLKFLIN